MAAAAGQRPPAPTEANHIIDKLFLGSCEAAEDVSAMKKRNISHILICHPDLPALHKQHFSYFRLPLADTYSANLIALLPRALEFLCKAQKEGTGTFIHCQKGRSRSASCLIAWLMFQRRISFLEAWDICRKKRPDVYPNISFQIQLTLAEALFVGLDAKATLEERLEQAMKVLRQAAQTPTFWSSLEENLSQQIRQVVREVQDRLPARVDPRKLCGGEGGSEEQQFWYEKCDFLTNVSAYKVIPDYLAPGSEFLEVVRQICRSLGTLQEAPELSKSYWARMARQLVAVLSEWADLGEQRPVGKFLLLGGSLSNGSNLGTVGNDSSTSVGNCNGSSTGSTGSTTASSTNAVEGLFGTYDSSEEEDEAPAKKQRKDD